MKRRVVYIFFCFLLVTGLLSWPTPVTAAVGGSFNDNWDWANPLPQGDDLKAVACDGVRYVAVGDSGAVVTSTGGETWVNADLDLNSNYNAAAYGGGLFLAGGESGSVGRSADGRTWTYGSSYEEDYDTGITYGTEEDILGMTYGEGCFVAVGAGFIITSADGESWSEVIAASETLNGVTYGNGYFVAVGDSGLIMYSDDGTIWNSGTIGTGQDLAAVTYGSGTYVAVGQQGTILTAASLDAGAWESGTIWYEGTDITDDFDYSLYSAAYGNGLYVILSDGGMYLTSSNGTDWTATIDQDNLTRLYSVVSGDDGFTAVGSGGLIITIDSVSTGWTKRSSGSNSYLNGMTYDNGLFVAVGSNEIMTSSNGVDWVSRSVPEGIGTLEGVAGNGSGGFAAAGYLQGGSGYIGTLAYSTDGTTWQMATTGAAMMLRGVTYGVTSGGTGLYVAVGHSTLSGRAGIIFTSEDGDNWTLVPIDPINGLTDVTYGDGRFVAVSEEGTSVTSTDGSSWTEYNINADTATLLYNGVAYGGGLFIAVGGGSGRIVTSVDGAVWTDLGDNGVNFNGIAYGDGYFIAVGQSGQIMRIAVSAGSVTDPAQPGVMTGVNMTRLPFDAAAYGNGVYAVVGDNGAILYSPPVDKYVLTVAAGAGGRITKGTSGPYEAGSEVNVSASASSGYTFSGWTSSGEGTFADSAAASTTYTMLAEATTVTASFTANSPGDGGGGGGGGSNTPDNSTPTNYGALKKEGSVCTAVIDSGKLSLGEKGKTIVIAVTDLTARSVNFRLTVADLKKIADHESVLHLETPFGIYKLPAVEIDFNSISKKYSNIDYSNILLNVAFAKTGGSNAALNGAGIVGQPVEISVTLEAGGKKIELDEFTQYVERDLPVAAGEKFATGVVIEDNGTLRHVPTKETTINGKRYAAVFSRTNSVYCLIDNRVSFNDMTGHWAEKTVGDMASRLIISGAGNNRFDPDQKITRAQFAAIVVRALGLKSEEDASFTDVTSKDWYHETAAAACQYGIVLGGADGRFRPNDDISRQEAMVMIARAMKIAGMDTSISEEGVSSALSGFTDSGMIPGWAEDAAATTVQSGIVNGSNGKLRPNDTISRAETAVMVQRLLQKAGLI